MESGLSACAASKGECGGSSPKSQPGAYFWFVVWAVLWRVGSPGCAEGLARQTPAVVFLDSDRLKARSNNWATCAFGSLNALDGGDWPENTAICRRVQTGKCQLQILECRYE